MSDFSGIVDSHCHLDASLFDEDREELIEKLSNSGFDFIVSIGDTPESATKVAKMTEYHDFIYGTVGMHPHYASQFTKNTLVEVKGLLKNPKMLAVGEIGLDYHYDYAPQKQQIYVFEQMLDLAIEQNYPIVIHNRKSDQDLLSILDSFKPSWDGIVHCFDSDTSMAEKCLDRGFFISFSGMVTFKKREDLREVVKMTPLDKILIETDAPFLTPHPHRGKRNDPSYVIHVAHKIAELKEIDVSKVIQQTKINARNVYQLCA